LPIGADMTFDNRREVPVPPMPPLDAELTLTGKFRKARVKPIKNYGAYRGEGSLRFTPSGIQVMGRHVKPLGTRWLIGLGILVGSLIITVGRFALGFIPIYFILEYGLLDDGNRLIPWSSVAGFATDAGKQLVSIHTTESEKHLNTLVLRTQDHAAALATLQRHVHEMKASR
jgi:hypothetical protein